MHHAPCSMHKSFAEKRRRLKLEWESGSSLSGKVGKWEGLSLRRFSNMVVFVTLKLAHFDKLWRRRCLAFIEQFGSEK
jgi:hypothetical protein